MTVRDVNMSVRGCKNVSVSKNKNTLHGKNTTALTKIQLRTDIFTTVVLLPVVKMPATRSLHCHT